MSLCRLCKFTLFERHNNYDKIGGNRDTYLSYLSWGGWERRAMDFVWQLWSFSVINQIYSTASEEGLVQPWCAGTMQFLHDQKA